MRKLSSLILALLITLTLVKPQEARAEMPAKARAFLTIVGYGTAGGALLGAASLAFGTSTRAVAQGASLGLYAGILFGTYVLVSHHNKRAGNYDDNGSPYQDSTDVYGEEYQPDEGGGSTQEESNDNSFYNRLTIVQQRYGLQTKGGQLPPLKINLLQYNF